MDAVFIEGVAAVVSGIIVFCGSVWLLLSMVMGPRLAYFVSATVTLGFLLIMGLVWSTSPLGPVGKAPEWEPEAIAEDVSQLDFGPAGDYPDSPWRVPNPDDAGEVTRVAELGTKGLEVLEQEIDENDIGGYEDITDAAADPESVRLLQQGDTEYGAVTFSPIEGKPGADVVTILAYNPGNPLGPGRMITAGTLLLFLGHLFGLSRAEKKARRGLAPSDQTTSTA